MSEKERKRRAKVSTVNRTRFQPAKSPVLGCHRENDVGIRSSPRPREVVSPVTRFSDLKWHDGNRIVNLGVLAKGLESCCFCGDVLRLSDCQSETKYGGGSILNIPCRGCSVVNAVYTNKTHRDEKTRGMAKFDINTKVATGMLIKKKYTSFM